MMGNQQTMSNEQMMFQQRMPQRMPQFMSGQGQLSSSSMTTDQGQLTSAMMGGQFNSLGQTGMTSLNGQLALQNWCAPLNCPMIPICSFPSVVQMPMIGGCPSCPICVAPGGCTINSECSLGTYCVLGRCMPYALQGESCAAMLCQPPLVCTVMGTCYLPSCSCGYLPCPLSEQITTEVDDSLVTGGCPPCPKCRS